MTKKIKGVKSKGRCVGKIFGLIALVIVLALVACTIAAVVAFFKKEDVKTFDYSQNQYINTGDRTYISAHRAGGNLAPEETMSAFKLCMESTDYVVDIVEFDLHITKDNQLVLLHDDTVNRTSNATEKYGKKKVYVKDLTLQELKELNFGENFQAPDGNYPYRGLTEIPDDIKILSLREILDYLTAYRPELQYIIEIKDNGKNGKKAMDILYEMMKEYNILNQTIVGTFHSTISKYIDKQYPDVTRSAGITEVLGVYMGYIFNINLDKDNTPFKYNVLQIPKGLFIWDLGSTSFINYVHKMDIAVQYWTINDPEVAERLAENGADCVMSDDPKAVYEKYNQ